MTTESVYTAHDVADLFNLLPTVVGFVPSESICAITTTGPRRRFGFRMRVDLPPSPEHAAQAGRFVAGHLRNGDADGAIVLVVSSRTDAAASAARAVERNLGRLEPVVVAWSDGSRYWTTDPLDDPAGTPMELSPHHPAVVSAVLAGQEVLPDRATLERRWAPLRDEAGAWLAAQVRQVERQVALEALDLPAAAVGARGLAEVLAATERVPGAGLPDAGAVLRAAVWLTHGQVRDHVWTRHDRRSADSALAGWRDLARRAPGGYAAVPFTVAGYLAYLVGDGAQASIAFGHALEADPGFAMAQDLAAALMSGLHPDDLLRIVGRARDLTSP
jgi:hypothetical protein